MKISRRTFHVCQQGVEALELAVILPVFIALLFGFIDVARLVSAYSTVRTASFMGGRFAIARQRSEWISVESVLGNAQAQSVSVGGATLQSEPIFVSRLNNSHWYREQCLAQGIDPPELYRVEVRAIAYANKIMSESLGSAQYPCLEEGCFRCFTLRGDEKNYERYFSVLTAGGIRTWGAKVLALSCTYEVPITSAVFGLGWLPKSIPVTGRAYIPMNDYAGSAYDPDV